MTPGHILKCPRRTIQISFLSRTSDTVSRAARLVPCSVRAYVSIWSNVLGVQETLFLGRTVRITIALNIISVARRQYLRVFSLDPSAVSVRIVSKDRLPRSHIPWTLAIRTLTFNFQYVGLIPVPSSDQQTKAAHLCKSETPWRN